MTDANRLSMLNRRLMPAMLNLSRPRKYTKFIARSKRLEEKRYGQAGTPL